MLWKTQVALIILFLILAGVISEVLLNTPIIENDFLGLITLSKSIDPFDFHTFHNGIYPPGYVLILSFMIKSGVNLILLSKIFNWIFLLLLIFSLRNLIKDEVSLIFIVLAISFAIFGDKIYSNSIISPGPYTLFTFLALVGLVSKSKNLNSLANSWGLFLIFISTLIRYEGIILLASICIYEIFYGKEKKEFLKVMFVLIISILIPIALAYYATGNPLHTYHRIGVAEISWHSISPEVELKYLDLEGFFRFYFENIRLDIFYLIPLLLYMHRFPEKKSKILPLVIFFFLIKLHPSPRGVLIIVPFTYISLVIMIKKTLDDQKQKWLFDLPILCVLIVIVLFRFSYNLTHKREVRFLSKTYDQIEKVLLEDVYFSSVSKVFTNDFNFFMRSQLPETPKVNGGWISFNSNFYYDSPNISLDGYDQFVVNLKKSEITHLMLDKIQMEDDLLSDTEKGVFLKIENSEKFRLLNEFYGRYLIYQVNY